MEAQPRGPAQAGGQPTGNGSAEKELGVLLGSQAVHEPAVCVPVAKKAAPPGYPVMHWEEHCQQLEGDPVPLLSLVKLYLGVLCPVLRPSAQDRHGASGAGPGEGDKDDEETGTPHL